MFFGKNWSAWIEQYESGHQHPVNRFCHILGIPLIAAALILFLAAVFFHRL